MSFESRLGGGEEEKGGGRLMIALGLIERLIRRVRMVSRLGLRRTSRDLGSRVRRRIVSAVSLSDSAPVLTWHLSPPVAAPAVEEEE